MAICSTFCFKSVKGFISGCEDNSSFVRASKAYLYARSLRAQFLQLVIKYLHMWEFIMNDIEVGNGASGGSGPEEIETREETVGH